MRMSWSNTGKAEGVQETFNPLITHSINQHQVILKILSKHLQILINSSKYCKTVQLQVILKNFNIELHSPKRPVILPALWRLLILASVPHNNISYLL